MQVPEYDEQDYVQRANMLLSQLEAESLQSPVERVVALSRMLLGTPYLDSALGEGPHGQFDQSPLFRFDAFDCVTFVNTVLALASSVNVDEFISTLLQLNYQQGQAHYQYRHHFYTVDWYRTHIESQRLHDVTLRMTNAEGRVVYNIARVLIDRPNWYLLKKSSSIKQLQPLDNEKATRLLKQLWQYSEQVQTECGELPYIPLTQLIDQKRQPQEALLQQIPQGAIIAIVRPNWDLTAQIGTHLNVSHVGFAIWEQDQLLLRHASSVQQQVVEMPLIAYLSQYLESPTIKGISIVVP